MKHIILGLGLFISVTGFTTTNNYDLKMELSLNGNKVASPRRS